MENPLCSDCSKTMVPPVILSFQRYWRHKDDVAEKICRRLKRYVTGDEKSVDATLWPLVIKLSSPLAKKV